MSRLELRYWLITTSFMTGVLAIFILQWNPVNTDTKGTRQNVRIIGVSVLSGFPEKKKQKHVLWMKDHGNHFLG